jgi:hypothetical protein
MPQLSAVDHLALVNVSTPERGPWIENSRQIASQKSTWRYPPTSNEPPAAGAPESGG